MLGLPNELYIVIIGLGISGIALSFSILPLMPVMVGATY
jgi:hypothetical protein